MISRPSSPSRKSSFKHPEVFGKGWHWRTVFLASILLKTYFSLATSYIHPDEHFQGPEAVADHVFGWATKRSWEFTSETPVRSYFVAWIVYGLPMTFIETIFASKSIDPLLVLYCLRLVFTLGSWILSDMAIDRLTRSKQHRLAALFFYSTSYVSWVYQSHTFSNSIETVVLLWCLVIIHEFKTKCQSWFSKQVDAAMLGCLVAFGIFNRVTFPAFLLIPGVRLIPWLLKNPIAVTVMGVAFACTSILAIYVDTILFSISNHTSIGLTNVTETISQFMDETNIMAAAPKNVKLVIAPLNLFLYNVDTANLALHGIHSRLNHILVNLPQLFGPALLLLFSSKYLTSLTFQSAISGLVILSSVSHQEPRFIIPVIPLLCCCLDFSFLVKSKLCYKIFFVVWFVFNILMATLMGSLHQGGIIPAQVFISKLAGEGNSSKPVTESPDLVCLWWKTYSPPIWLLGKPVGSVEVIDPVETIGGGGDNIYRYQPVFSYLADIESSLGDANDYTFLKGPSSVLDLSLNSNSTRASTKSVSSSPTPIPIPRSRQETYSNPNSTALTASPKITVMDLMGASPSILFEIMSKLAVYTSGTPVRTLLIAPIAAFELNENLQTGGVNNTLPYKLEHVWKTQSHLSLDDLDFSNIVSLTPGLGIWELTAA